MARDGVGFNVKFPIVIENLGESPVSINKPLSLSGVLAKSQFVQNAKTKTEKSLLSFFETETRH